MFLQHRGAHPFTWKTPTPPENIRTKKFWFGFLFRILPDQSWGSGSGGVKSAGVPQSVRETGRDESQSVPSPEKNSTKQGIWSSQFLRDLSQVVRCTPRDTPVPLCTRTSPWPTKGFPGPLGPKAIKVRKESKTESKTREKKIRLVIFFFPYNPPPPPSRQTPQPSHPRELDFGPFRLRFGPFRVRLAPFGSVSGLFQVRF